MASANTTLYAWAAPAFVSGAPVDHTWVTDYDNRSVAHGNVGQVVAAGAHYWFCWGSFHSTGGTPAIANGLLLSRKGNLPTAICLVLPNADSRLAAPARGTIFSYGVDGVCHQLANQVLFACGGSPPIVSSARGYAASAFLYGDYGLQHSAWAAKIASCSAPRRSVAGGRRAAAGIARSTPMGPDMQDEFEKRAQAALGGSEPERLQRLLALRERAQVGMRSMVAQRTGLDVEGLNARNQAVLNEAAQLLTAAQFQEIFGFAPGEKINLVLESEALRQIKKA
ncbi:MAG: hypothetical protein JNK46_15030 [Methylobacteriaceae bacterium]|nr:hypothetical protein [Methylobacteriaceae bacterium]